MSNAPGSSIEIKPKIKYLSATELIAQRNAVVVESPRSGLKRTNCEDTEAEREELKNAHSHLRLQLSTRRIERQAGRAIAVWRENQQAAEVLRKDGKFESFGFSQNGKLYLEYYEALFLVEVNRLQLEYCGMIMSVEQAYVLLLGEESSERYNNYLVYSTLSRAGYIVVKHQTTWTSTTPGSVTSEDCIWALLDAALSNKPVPLNIKVSQFYNTTQERMTTLTQQIKGQMMTKEENCQEDEQSTAFQFETRKRKVQSEQHEEVASKRANTRGKSLIDDLKSETSYEKFHEIFNKLDLVQLHNLDSDSEGDTDIDLRSFEITFDLYLHNEGFRRSAPKMPSFSVIILPSDEPFPTHAEMRQHKANIAPLLVISVSESKQIQAFIYHIS